MSAQPPVGVTTSLTIAGANAALDFYMQAFDAKEHFRMNLPNSEQLMHAEFSVGETTIYLSDEFPDFGCLGIPEGQTSSMLLTIRCVEPADVDAAFRQAVAAGCTAMAQPQDQPWGERSAMVVDPYRYRWGFAAQTEELTPEEVMKRLQGAG